MKFMLNKARKDCLIPTSALGVAGLKREKELRLEVDAGVIVVMRRDMNAKKLLSVSEFLRDLAANMVAAVAVESGGCSCCGDCFEDDCECDYCDSQGKCHGIEIPACLLAKAGIADTQPWKADAEDGAIVIRAVPEGADGDEPTAADGLPDDIPEMTRLALSEAGVCVPRLREILCGNDPIPF